MKKLVLISLTSLGISQLAAADDAILGLWQTKGKDAIFEFIAFDDGSYGSKLIFGEQVVEADGKTSKKDSHNPDQSLRNRDLLGIINLTGLVYEDGKYTGGKIYDGRSGDFYDCLVELENGKLYLTGYIGFTWLGQTSVWHRLETNDKPLAGESR